jgi:hypothetical protein
MKIIQWWRTNFLRAELLLAILITVLIITVCDVVSISCNIPILASGRSILYGTLASIFGSLLGFTITAASIVIAFVDSPRLHIVRQSKHYPALWSIFFSTIRTVGLATLAALAGLLLDEGATTHTWILYPVIFTFLLACFRLARTVWALEKVVGLLASNKLN